MFQTAYERPRKSVRVSLTLTGRATIEGNLLILPDETVIKALNGPDAFLSFETDLCERLFIAKNAIERIGEIDVKARASANVAGAADEYRLTGRFASSDPYVVLGVPTDAPPDVLKQAYHKLARDFHPDKLASLELHGEMKAYADEVLKRVNMAYSIAVSAAQPAA